MTAQEAIEIIKYASAFNSDNSPLTKALDMAIEALEKQIPKKPRKINIPNTSWSKAHTRYECPSCGKYLNYKECTRCELCAQKLDWSE